MGCGSTRACARLPLCSLRMVRWLLRRRSVVHEACARSSSSSSSVCRPQTGATSCTSTSCCRRLTFHSHSYSFIITAGCTAVGAPIRYQGQSTTVLTVRGQTAVELNNELQLSLPFDSNASCHAVLVAWRNRWATGLRLLAPLMFLAMALMVQEVMNMNARRTGRIRDIPTTFPESISTIPACSSELFINDKPCLDFIFTPKDDARIQVCAGLPTITCQIQPVHMAVIC